MESLKKKIKESVTNYFDKEPLMQDDHTIKVQLSSKQNSSSKVIPKVKGPILAEVSKRDQALESKVLNWILSVVDEQKSPLVDYEYYIQDGSVLSKVMTAIVFNSVPMEDIDQTWGSNPAHDRVTALIREIKRYGVVDVFEVEDLTELRNIPKVTKCLAQLSKLAASDKENLLSCQV